MTDYALEGPVWASPTVTWSFAAAGDASFTGALDPAYQATVRAAAAQWSAVANVRLQEVATGTPGTDISVGWGSFDDTQVGETSYSYSVGTPSDFQPGVTIHLEDPALLALGTDQNATYDGTATTLYEVALHEFGHALGLGLSTDPDAVMNIRLGPSNTEIDQSDLAGIDALYGAKPGVAQIAAQMAQAVPGSDTVPVSGGNIGVYRFFDGQNGTQFLTSSVSEMNSIFATRPDLTFEGLDFAGVSPATSDPHATPIYRFFDTDNGTHFFTASQSEAATIAVTRPDLVAEQAGFDEHVSQQAGDLPVYRFFDTHAGTHFFTASDSERATVVATRPDMTYEGIAFYAPAGS